LSTRYWLSLLVILFLTGLFYADLTIAQSDPWVEFSLIFKAAFFPDFFATENLFNAILNTIAFALYGILLSIIIGFLLSLMYSFLWVRVFCAYIRGVHELFWALIFVTLFGLSPLSGLIAIVLPYSGIFARVFAELMEQIDPLPEQVMLGKSRVFDRFLYARLPQAIALFRSYTRYRVECALKSSAILGFVGLPTLGFYLDTAFREGEYQQAWALLYIFFAIIALKKWWLKPYVLIPIYLVSFWQVSWLDNALISDLWRFFSVDIMPAPLRAQSFLEGIFSDAMMGWLSMMWQQQAYPGIYNSLNLTMLSVGLTALLSLFLFPVRTHLFVKYNYLRNFGSLFLIMIRSVPELILTFLFVLLWGPSMLPAILALALHNAGIIAYLLSMQADQLELQKDTIKSSDLYLYKVLPRLFHSLLVFLFYRAEVILRETAILGMLGIATLGFYIDSAFEDLRYDRAIFLINITAILNIIFEMLARKLRNSIGIAHAYEKH
jgi:phosphonate transport system permease protein